MVFVTAGTAVALAPAQEPSHREGSAGAWNSTIGVVTKPFHFEGQRR